MRFCRLLALSAFAGLVGCGPAGPISLPVVGKLSNGDTAQGNVVIDLETMRGDFNISTLRGLTCGGSYDANVRLNTITIPVTCNDGRKGVVIATRDASGVAGTATGRLDNGMSGKFLFGYVSAQMQAEFLAD